MIEETKNVANELALMIYALFVMLDLDVKAVKVLFYLMVIDTILGIIKITVLGIKFSVKKLAIGFVSKLAILLIPMALALMSKGLNYDFKWFVHIAIDILIVSDGISIFSNAIAIKTKKEVENFDAITKLLKAVRSALINLFKKFVMNLEKSENDE